MGLNTSPLEFLQPVQELNRAFLGFVQSRARRGLDCLEFPADVRTALCGASNDVLDSVALFPHALFGLRFDAAQGNVLRDASSSERDASLRDMTLLVLYAARSASRRSGYQARLLFGLDDETLRQLRSLPLVELQRLSLAPGVLRCAFTDRAWLWQGLLTDDRPETLRRLVLVALQPGLAGDWPRRRAPLAVT